MKTLWLLPSALWTVCASVPARAQGDAQATQTLSLDNFEDGVGQWARNDKGKAANPSAPVLLVDVLATQPSPGGPAGSTSAGLFTFKAAEGSWASASLKIEGTRWASFGARALRFWLNADGQAPGVELLLRGTSRNRDGSARDVAYSPTEPGSNTPIPVKLSTKRWRQVVIPLDRFRDKDGASAQDNLAGLYLLQFVQRGNWNSRFFTVDDVALTGTGKAAPNSNGASPSGSDGGSGTEATPTQAPGSPDAGSSVVAEIDFLRRPGRSLGRIRASANVSVGAQVAEDGTPSRPFDDAGFATAIKTLAPKMVRIEAGEVIELIDSSRPSFDFSALQAAVRGARAVGAEPLVSLGAPSSWGLEATGYASYAAQAARALNLNTKFGPKYFELPVGNMAPSQAAAFYRAAYASIKAASKSYRVGGIGTSNTAALRSLLASAPGLDFLSLPFYGATTGTPEMASLMNATLSLGTLKAAAQVLDGSKYKLAPLYITSAGANAARSEGSSSPSDERLGSMAAAAWWSSLLLNGSRLADQVFYDGAANPASGLLNADHSAFPPYYALYLWNTFFPAGSERAAVKVSGAPRGVQILGVNTTTAHNALFVNTSGEALSIKLTIRGFAVLRQARLRVLQEPLDPTQGIAFTDLPKSPFQNFSLPPYSTAVLQFIEPPKAAPRATPAARPRKSAAPLRTRPRQ